MVIEVIVTAACYSQWDVSYSNCSVLLTVGRLPRLAARDRALMLQHSCAKVNKFVQYYYNNNNNYYYYRYYSFY